MIKRKDIPEAPLLLTRVRFGIQGRHLLGILGLLACLAGGRASRERTVREEGAVDVAGAVASGRRAIDTLEFHGGGCGDGGLVLFDSAATLQHPHLVSVSNRASGCAVALKRHRLVNEIVNIFHSKVR